MTNRSAWCEERAKSERPLSASASLPVALILSLLILPSALAYDFAGRVEKVDEPNIMWVNVTEDGTYGRHAVVEVLLNKPLEGLAYFRGQDLQFEIQGHDILGRPVCEAFQDGMNIREAYYCILYPVECSYRRSAPDSGYGPGYGYDYAPLPPYGRHGYCAPYGNCCPDGYYCSYDYPWLSFI